MLSSKSPSKFYDNPTATNLLKAMSNSVSIISGHPLYITLIFKLQIDCYLPRYIHNYGHALLLKEQTIYFGDFE